MTKRQIQQKLERLCLIEAIGNFTCDLDSIKAYKKLVRACKNGQGERQASRYCIPWEPFEMEDAKTLLDHINSCESALLQLVNQARSIK